LYLFSFVSSVAVIYFSLIWLFHDFFFFLINSIAVENKIGADGAKFISEGMKENKVMTNLSLGGMFNIFCKFSQVLVSPCFSHFIFLVCFLISSFPKINSIIVGNKIGADGANFISEGMKENTVITNLDLSGMCIFI